VFKVVLHLSKREELLMSERNRPSQNVTGDPDLDFIYSNNTNILYLTWGIEQTEFTDLWKPIYGGIVSQLYGVDTMPEVRAAMLENRNKYDLNDFEIWREIGRQSVIGFDESLMKQWDTSPKFLEHTSKMRRGPLLFGASIAVNTIFGSKIYSKDGREAAIGRMQKALTLDDNATTHIIRAAARHHSTEGTYGNYRQEGDRILLEAVRRPKGLVREAVSDEEGKVDFRYFNGPDILKNNAYYAFDAMIGYSLRNRQLEEHGQDYTLLKAEFPDEFAAIEQEADFIYHAVYKVRERIYEYSADSRSEKYQDKMVPPDTALELVPADAVAVIADDVVREINDFMPKVKVPFVASAMEAALKGIGPDYVSKTKARASLGIDRIQAALAAL
jgi:hypothetical protein